MQNSPEIYFRFSKKERRAMSFLSLTRSWLTQFIKAGKTSSNLTLETRLMGQMSSSLKLQTSGESVKLKCFVVKFLKHVFAG